jgi:hypothetical protein
MSYRTTTQLANEIAELRRMVNEPTTTNYSDAVLAGIIEKYMMMDQNGVDALYVNHGTTPPSFTLDTTWMPTYDLNASAADIWAEKAAKLTEKIDFAADGGNYSQSQAHAMAMKQANYYAKRRKCRSVNVLKYPVESSTKEASQNGI